MTRMTTAYPLKNKIFSTEAGITVSLLRLAMGWIFFFEGSRKLFAWFGGGGIEGIIGYFQSLNIPFAYYSAYLVGGLEFVCGLLFIFGFLVRFASAATAVIMATAIFTAHRAGGYNYPLLIFFACLLLLQHGAGKLSLDCLCARRKNPAP